MMIGGRDYPIREFDFLGYTFRARRSKNRWGKYFINFSPAISNKAAKAIRAEITPMASGTKRSDKDAGRPVSYVSIRYIRGWINYYGCYYRSALYPILDAWIAAWCCGPKEIQKLARSSRRAAHWLGGIARREPKLFAHWQMGVMRRLDDGSRMSGDVHVRFCEGLRG